MDEYGHCWKTAESLGKPVTFDDAAPTDYNVKLSPDCTQKLLDTFFANQVSKVATYAMAAAGDLTRGDGEMARRLFPVMSLKGTRLQMTMATTRQRFAARNITLTSVDPFAVKFGTCYDHLEWWQAQDLLGKSANWRMPDGLEVIVSQLRARVHFEWSLVQDFGVGSVSVGEMQLARGEADVGIVGMLVLGVDLHDPAKAAIEQCKGKFEFEEAEFEGEQLNDKFLGLMIKPFFPEFAAQISELLCYGNVKKRPTSVLDVMGGLQADMRMDNDQGVTFGFVGAQEGINYMVSHALEPVGFYMQQDAIWHNDPATRWKRAKGDQALLAEVGVHEQLGTGRFSHITLPPPTPPEPPSPPPAPPVAPLWLERALPSWLRLPVFSGTDASEARGLPQQRQQSAWTSLFRPSDGAEAATKRGGVGAAQGLFHAVPGPGPGWSGPASGSEPSMLLILDPWEEA